jgi:hypothetical protein
MRRYWFVVRGDNFELFGKGTGAYALVHAWQLPRRAIGCQIPRRIRPLILFIVAS